MLQSECEEKVETKISRTHLMIVPIAKSMSTATGVVKEIAMAERKDVLIFAAYVGGADATSTLPIGLARNRTIA